MKNLHSFRGCKKIKTAVLIISTFFLSGFAALFSSCIVESDSSYPTMLMSISADYYDMKTNYAVGEKLDLTGLKVYATFSDGSFKEIKDYQTSYSKGYTFTDKDAEQCSYSGMGYLELRISYQGFQICVFLYVSAAGTSNVESIQISEPSKKNYRYGEKLDLSGLTVTALYPDGTTKTVSGWTSFPADGSELKKTGTQEIQIYYGGVSASFSIEVSALDGSKSTSFFWGKWIRMDTGTVYEVLDTVVKVNGTYKPIISCSDSSINISEVGTLEKDSDRIIKNEDNIPFFRYGGTNLEYSLKVVGFTDSGSRAVSSTGLKGLKGKGKSDTYSSFETKESYTDENGLITLTAPTVGDSQTVTIEKDDGGLVVVPNIVIENTGDFMGTVAIVEENQYNLKVTGVIDESEKDSGYLFGNSAKTYTMTITIENISDIDCLVSTYEILPDDPRLTIEPYDGDNETSGTILTLPKHAPFPIKVKLTYGDISQPFVDTGITIKINNAKLDSAGKLLQDENKKLIYQEWTDYIPLKFYRGLIPITIAAESKFNKSAALNGFIIYPDGNNQFFAVPSGQKKVFLVPTFGEDKKYLLVFSGATVTQELSKSTEIFYTVSPGSSSVLPIDLNPGIDIIYNGEVNDTEEDAVSMDEAFEAYLHKEDIDYWQINGESSEIFAPGNKSYCTVSFKSDYGQVPNSFFVPEGNALTASQIYPISAPGMTFAGWYNNGNEYKAGSLVNGNIELVAQWVIADYSINYVLNGGNATEPDAATNSSNNLNSYRITDDTIPVYNPARSYYTFDGWYKTSDFTGEQVTEIPTGSWGDITLYAKWIPVTYKVTFYDVEQGELSSMESNIDGEGAVFDVKENHYILYYNFDSDITLLSAKRAHYSFDGWYEGSTFEEDTKIEKLYKCHGDKDIYANWTVGNYRITYNLNGGTNAETNPASFSYDSNDITILPPTKKGNKFLGWYTSKTFEDKYLFDNVIPHNTDEDIELYAKWEIENYTITYELFGGTNNSQNPSSYTIDSSDITLKDPTFKTHAFLGWFLTSDFEEGTAVTKIETSTLTSYVLYAKWDIETYPITYNMNDGTAGADDVAENNSENPLGFTSESAAITLKPASRNGYTFKGWYTDSSLETPFVSIPAGTTAAVEVWAKWEAITYTISYVLNGGAAGAVDEAFNSPSNVTEYTIEDWVALNNPHRNGYTFAGWYETEDFSSSKLTGLRYKYGNKTLYAKWTMSVYDINYDWGNGGLASGENPTKYTITSYITLLSPVRTGYTFGGWYTNSSYTGDPVSKINKGTYGTLWLYAKWTPVQYPITYNLDGGTNSSANPAYYTITDSVTLGKPTKEGLIFKGWYTTSDCQTGTEISKISLGSTGAKTVWAKWVTPGAVKVEFSSASADALEITETVSGSDYTFTVPATASDGTAYTDYSWDVDGNGTSSLSSSSYTVSGRTFTLRTQNLPKGSYCIYVSAKKGLWTHDAKIFVTVE